MSKAADKEWRTERNAQIAEAGGRDTRYTLHRVTNMIFAVCQFAAMICHIICFGVMLSKINELKDKFGDPEDQQVCILFMEHVKVKDADGKEHDGLGYNGGYSCEFVIYASIALTILAVLMLIFLTVRILFVKKMNFIGVLDVVEIIIAVVLTFAVSVTISIGRAETCSGVKEVYDSCNGAALVPPGQDHPRVSIYSALKTTETSSWVAFLFLFVIGVLALVRTIRWFVTLRRERRYIVSAGLINSEVTPSTDEVDDKTPAAI